MSTSPEILNALYAIRNILNFDIIPSFETIYIPPTGPTISPNTVDIFGDASSDALFFFDDNVLDLSGNYNGTSINMTYGVGRAGKCAQILNVNTKLYTINNPLKSNRESYSISCFIKRSVNTSNVLFASFNALSSPYNGLLITFSDTVANDMRVSSYFNGIESGYFYVPVNSKFSDGAWHHYCFVLQQIGNKTSVYIDGVEVVSTTLYNGTFSHGSYFQIGSYYNSTVNMLNGSIEQLRIFNRALSEAEVLTLCTEI